MIVRVRANPGGVDEYGDPIAGSTDRVDLPDAFVAPRASSDIDGRGRDGVVVGLTLFAPQGSDVVRTDLVEVDGDDYEIDGDVADWSHPLTGWEPGITASLVRATG